MRKKAFEYLKSKWGQILLVTILLIIVVLNLKPGYLILGNDNFSPELNPGLTLERSLLSPGWRNYRALGLPSDSEQADIFRTLIFWLLSKFFPVWFISQGYLFFTFIIAGSSMGFLVKHFGEMFGFKNKQLLFFIGGLFYLTNLLTSWLYFYPIHLFIATYAFLPLILWRLGEFFKNFSAKNGLLLLISSLLLSTTALTATMFIIDSLLILIFSSIYFFQNRKTTKPFKNRATFISGIFLTVIIQSFWFLPFAAYAKTNRQALQNSQINQEITSTAIENEIKNNTAANSIRYYASWIETKEDGVHYSFPYRDWYKNNFTANVLSFLPLALAAIGTIFLISSRNFSYLPIPIIAVTGWFFIKGVNPPLGQVFEFFQKNIPLFSQVFRWQSSKFWPFLAVSLPILAGFGVTALAKIFKNRLIFFLIFLAITIGSLVFVWPYFKGDLVRDKVFVKIPGEYFKLADYLEDTDKNSRLYLAPEENSLYFRNYCWGFWGSTFLNYLIPNPIVEKALIVGSYENETAFGLLRNAYYSENPLLFARTLSFYETPLVLSDKNSCQGDVGYDYDWAIHQKMVEENPYFTRIWEEGKLALFKVKETLLNQNSPPQLVSSLHNWPILNAINLKLDQSFSFFSNEKNSGSIYPFALKFDRAEFKDSEMVASINFKGRDTYFWQPNEEQILSSPTKIEYDPVAKKIKLLPAAYYFSVNSIKFFPALPAFTNVTTNSPVFLSLNENILNLSYALSAVFDLPFAKATEAGVLKEWQPKSQLITVEEKEETVIDKDSVIELSLAGKVEKETETSLCFWSTIQQRCLNFNNYSRFSEGKFQRKILIPQIIQKDDKIKVYLNLLSGNDALKNITISLNLYQENKAVKLTAESDLKIFQQFSIDLRSNDLFSLHLPLTTGQNSFFLKPEDGFFPQSDVAPFERNKGEGKITLTKDNSILFSVKEGNTSLYPRLERIDPRDGLAMIAFAGENLQAIPPSILIRNFKQEFEIYKRRLSPLKNETFFDLFFLPEQVRSYTLEVFSTAIGPRPSINRIDKLAFQIIPQSWLETMFVPENETIITSQEIFKISQAVSPNWQLWGVKGEPIRINGWQQGWLMEKTTGNQKVKVVFWPDFLSYFGYLLIILTTLGLFLLALKPIFGRKHPGSGELQKF